MKSPNLLLCVAIVAASLSTPAYAQAACNAGTKGTGTCISTAECAGYGTSYSNRCAGAANIQVIRGGFVVWAAELTA